MGAPEEVGQAAVVLYSALGKPAGLKVLVIKHVDGANMAQRSEFEAEKMRREHFSFCHTPSCLPTESDSLSCGRKGRWSALGAIDPADIHQQAGGLSAAPPKPELFAAR